MKAIVKKVINYTELITIPLTEFLALDNSIIKYMVMHWFGGILLIYTVLLPIFMNKLGINIITAGAIFSITALVDVILTFILSRFLDKISPNIGMSLDWLTESLPPLIYSLASTPFHFVLGSIAGRITNILNPVYKVYENEIFSKDKQSLIYTYHLITPEVFTLIFYSFIGYLLTYKFTSIFAFRVVFLICGIGFLFVALIPYKFLKWVELIEITKHKAAINFPRELYLVALAQILIFVGLNFASMLVTSYYILDKMQGTVMDVLVLKIVSSLVVIFTGLYSKNLGSKISEVRIAQ
ncbi:hypothetical protein BBF96_10260 [Anoxybacter fermentans]|uniref:Major facilitator superfamily (MFS) profile domain-containing protein n=1 Tax=Anoxybacter fermentans TaxID=1323375 RepID=A0A3Q9HQX0_9FIRM|nr:MFS transporter [Anoxybacter fermentans]AZR73733.1 hypothetical protein BBF96_10260 [Anoxybacter fermentans]